MPFSVVMPALEMAQETGKLVAWRKKEGESVCKGEPLLEIETDKAVLEVESPAEGVLAGVSAEIGSVVPVGQTIAWIVNPGEPVPDQIASAVPAKRMQEASVVKREIEGEGSRIAGIKISPKARRLAKERGIDIDRLKGSGPDGEILSADVLSADSTDQFEVPGAVGRLMAERMTQSWTTVPHFFVTREVDCGALVAAREKLAPLVERSHNIRLTHTDLLISAIAHVLPRHSRLNATWIDSRIRLNREIHVAIAIAVEDGVVAAVIRDTARLPLAEIAAERFAVTERARSGHLRPTDLNGATFAISNLGMYQVDAFSAILPPGQAAILAVGSVADRAVVRDGQIAIQPMMNVTLSCDHRVVDGAHAARFLQDLVEALRKPEDWLR